MRAQASSRALRTKLRPTLFGVSACQEKNTVAAIAASLRIVLRTGGLILRHVVVWQHQLRPDRKQRQHAQMKQEPAPIDRIHAIRSAVVQQSVRQRMSEMWASLLEKDVLDVRRNRPAEDRV